MTEQPLLNPFNFPSPVEHNSPEDHTVSEQKPFTQPTPISTPTYSFEGKILVNSPSLQRQDDTTSSWGFNHDGSPVLAESFQSNLNMTDMSQNHVFTEQNQNGQFVFNANPYILNHSSSSSSLASVSSSPSQHGTSMNNSLLVQTFPPEPHFDVQSHATPHNMSRQSSFSSLASFDEKPFSTFMPNGHHMSLVDFNNFHLPQMTNNVMGQHLQGSMSSGNVFDPSTPDPRQPKLEVQTQGLGRMVGRTRSASRSMPYARHHKSESLSAASEEDEADFQAVMSASTNHSGYQTPWSTGTNSNITGSLGRMTLHHRRTSSVTQSPQKINPQGRPMLSRAHRSSSLALLKRESQEFLAGANDLKLQGSAAEREETVRRDLSEKAQAILQLGTASQQDKARTVWVRRWLVLSYTQEKGSTVPRQGLYHSYSLSCEEYGIKPINSASFGKAVRNAFPGIKTRRLGVRGNSKYHYVSIRPAIRVEAERLNAYGDSSGQWHVAPEDGTMGFSHNTQDMEMDGEDVDDEECEEDDEAFGPSTIKKSPSSTEMRSRIFVQRQYSHDRSSSNVTPTDSSTRPRGNFMRRHTTSALDIQSNMFNPTGYAQPASPVYTLPGFPSISQAARLGTEVDFPTLQAFWDGFCRHQETLAGCVRDMTFDRYEMNMRSFWRSLTPAMIQCCQIPVVSGMISDALAVCVDHMISVLLAKVLLPIAVSVQDALRGLANNLETITEDCFQGFDRAFADPKIEMIVRAAHLMHRFVDLHQLTSALTPILSNPEQVRNMLSAWDLIDMRSLLDQAALSCNCHQDCLEAILADFQRWLIDVEATPARGGKAIEKLGQWVDKTIGDLQNGLNGRPGIPLRALVPRAGWITSQVMRDFTLKSETSFGLFQLVKTWIDDWILISSVRQTGLSTSTVETASSLGSAINITIPTQMSDQYGQQDLTTAVPFANQSSSSISSNSSLSGQRMPDFSGGSTQYLSMPTFAVDGNLVTPRPFTTTSDPNATISPPSSFL